MYVFPLIPLMQTFRFALLCLLVSLYHVVGADDYIRRKLNHIAEKLAGM
jgi:hypothetical protein